MGLYRTGEMEVRRLLWGIFQRCLKWPRSGGSHTTLTSISYLVVYGLEMYFYMNILMELCSGSINVIYYVIFCVWNLLALFFKKIFILIKYLYCADYMICNLLGKNWSIVTNQEACEPWDYVVCHHGQVEPYSTG